MSLSLWKCTHISLVIVSKFGVYWRTSQDQPESQVKLLSAYQYQQQLHISHSLEQKQNWTIKIILVLLKSRVRFPFISHIFLSSGSQGSSNPQLWSPQWEASESLWLTTTKKQTQRPGLCTYQHLLSICDKYCINDYLVRYNRKVKS